MFFRRPSLFSTAADRAQRLSSASRKGKAIVRRSMRNAVQQCAPIEALEKRQLLTTLTGGGGTGGSLQTAIYEFLDGDDNTIRIAMRGNVTAEFIGMWVADGENDAPLSTSTNVLTNLILPNQQNPQAPAGTFLPGAFIYSIYIASADIDASISIARFRRLGEDRPMQPFGGSPAASTSSTQTPAKWTQSAPPARAALSCLARAPVTRSTGRTTRRTSESDRRAEAKLRRATAHTQRQDRRRHLDRSGRERRSDPAWRHRHRTREHHRLDQPVLRRPDLDRRHPRHRQVQRPEHSAQLRSRRRPAPPGDDRLDRHRRDRRLAP